MKILVVEDHAAVAQISCSLLREVYDHDVEHAASAADALAILNRFAPDMVLVDINLPDMNGYDLAKRIRALPGGANPKLVALTGWGHLIDAQAAAEAGFDAHFRKPMDFQQLPAIQRRPTTGGNGESAGSAALP